MENLKAEQAVIGTLLHDAKAAHFAAMLVLDDFDDPTHQLIFQAIAQLAGEGRAPSPIVLAPQFNGDRRADGTVADYLFELARTNAVPRDHMPDYVRALKEMAGRRMMSLLATQMADVARSPSASPQPFAERTIQMFGEMLSGLRRQRISSFSAGELAQGTIERLKARGKPNLVDTGLESLNRDIGGWPRGELTVLAGRPSMGKSTIALSCIRQAGRKAVASMLFSMEMGKDAVVDRMLADGVWNNQTPILYKNIIHGNIADWDIERLDMVRAALDKMSIEIDDQTGLSVAEMSVRARRHADRLAADGMALDAIWIDHLGYVRASERYRGQRVQEIGEITKGLRGLAKELDVAVILLCQLSREVERRDDKRPQLPDLRDSGNIEEDADTVLFAYREAYYLSRMSPLESQEKEDARQEKLKKLENILEIVGGKTRNGSIFARKFYANMGSNVIRDLAA